MSSDGRGGAVNPPPLPWGGGCQCGAVRFRVVAAPVALYACHCGECQRQSSSAFGMSMRMAPSAVEIDWDAMACFVRNRGEPTETPGWFCPTCGVRLIHGAPADEAVSLKAGTLDDTSWLRPVAHVFTARAQPWLGPLVGPLDAPAMPPSIEAIAAAWREATGA